MLKSLRNLFITDSFSYGQIKYAVVRSDGWTADVFVKSWRGSNITYPVNLDIDNRPTESTPYFLVDSRSWTDQGVETITQRKVYIREAVRIPAETVKDEVPSGEDMIIRVALSRYIYKDDKNISFNIPSGWIDNGEAQHDSIGQGINGSLRDYEVPIVHWLNQDLDRCESNIYTPEMVASHKFAQEGQGIRAIKYTASDSSGNSSSGIASTETLKSFAASGLHSPVYRADVDLSGLDAGVVITWDAEVYPWVGNKFTVSLDSNPYPTSNLCVLKSINDRDGSYGKVYAFVDGVGGGSPTASEVEATAQANPFATIRDAILAIQAYNNSNFGRNNPSGGHVKLTNAEHVLNDTFDIPDGDIPVVIESINVADKLTTIVKDDGALDVTHTTDKIKFKNLTMRRTTSGFHNVTGSDAWKNSDHIMVFENCHFDLNGNSSDSVWVFDAGRVHAVECTGDNCGQFEKFGTTSKSVKIIGCNGSNFVKDTAHLVIGTKDLDTEFKARAEDAGNHAFDGGFIGWSHLGNGTNAKVIIQVEIDIDSSGFAIVGNVIEQFGGTTNAAVAISATAASGTTSVSNILDIGNTIVGSRSNWLYQDTGSTTIIKDGAVRGSIHYLWNIKSDLFGTIDANRFGNWPEIYHVDDYCMVMIEGSSSGTVPGNNQWVGQIAPLCSKIGSPSNKVIVDFVDDQSNQGGGNGNGDYRPGVSTEIPQLEAGMAYFSYDHNGTQLMNDGNDYAGALQP